MQKKIRIKDIARIAGVSTGTVDRVIHNRGSVSLSAREAIEKALSEAGYKPNIHISGLSLKRRYRIIITTPLIYDGEYWDSIRSGILRAINDFGSIKVECVFKPYNQYDLYSCRDTFDEILKMDADAVIIGPTFKKETADFTTKLSERKTPYVFVDSTIDNASPLAFFSSDHYLCGYLLCKLMAYIVPADGPIGILQALRVGGESANTTILRKNGFNDYYTKNGMHNKLLSIPFSVSDPDHNEELLNDFFKSHILGGVVVLNSKASVVADYFERNNIRNTRMIGIDATRLNVDALKKGNIDFLIGQKPEYQGYMAVKTIIEYLVYHGNVHQKSYVPLDILTKETIDYHEEFNKVADYY